MRYFRVFLLIANAAFAIAVVVGGRGLPRMDLWTLLVLLSFALLGMFNFLYVLSTERPASGRLRQLAPFRMARLWMTAKERELQKRAAPTEPGS